MNNNFETIEDVKIELDRAMKFHRQGNLLSAERTYKKILKKIPSESNALNLLGLIEYQRGKFEDAVGLISRAIHYNNKNSDFFSNLGAVYNSMGRVSDAIEAYQQALKIKPNCPTIYYNLAGIFLQIGDSLKAVRFYEKAVANKTDFFQAYTNLSAIYNQQKQYEKALDYAKRGLRFQADDLALLNNKGNALNGLGYYQQAVNVFQKVINMTPNNPVGHINLANTLQDIGKFQEAVHHYELAKKLDPQNPKIHNDLGTVLKALRKYSEAIESYQAAIDLNKKDAFPYHNMGNIYLSMSEYEKAANYLKHAISLDPNLIEAYLSLGLVLQDTGQRKEAIDCFYKAISIDPEYSKAYCHLIRAFQHECRWEELDYYGPILDIQTKEALKKKQRPAEVPFLNLSRHCDPGLNYEIAKSWCDHLLLAVKTEKYRFSPRVKNSSQSNKKITVGYISNNFKNHPTSHLIVGLFKYHHRNLFEINCYSYGTNDDSIYRKQIERDSDNFVDITSLSNLEAAQKISDDKVDILVDLVGQMKSNRMEILALRPAPIQVRWLGMAGTSGGDFFDYIIVDRVVAPEEHKVHYTENFAYMPFTYQINNDTQIMAETTYCRKDFNLPDDGFVFSSFCSTYKIDSTIFKSWMKILSKVPGSVLWLLEPSKSAQLNLQREAKKFNIDKTRIIYAKKMVRSQHLARIPLSDLCLDTIIVNGAATTSEALWSGVPVLTLKGKHFASRMAASILLAMDLPELVTKTIWEYEDLAIRIGTDSNFYNQLRNKVGKNKNLTPLFDTKRFVGNLERLFNQMSNCYMASKEKSTLQIEANV